MDSLPISTNEMLPLGSMALPGDDEPEETAELEELGKEAKAFLESHRWCGEVLEGFLDRGFSKVAVFYFRIRPVGPDADPDVWVIAGDLPPAYMDTYNCPNGAVALEAYVCNLETWAEAVLSGQPLDGLMPVKYRSSFAPVEPSKTLANLIKSRIEFIRTNLLPDWADELAAPSQADMEESQRN